LTQEPQSLCAKRGTDALLSDSCGGANELEICEVGTGDQQHEAGQAEREPHHRSRYFIRRRELKRCQPQAFVLIRRGLARQICRKHLHRLLRVVDIDAGLQTCKRPQVVVAAIAALFR
jgi:hypothetical protein